MTTNHMLDDLYNWPEIYDILYQDKDYQGEAAFLIEQIESHCEAPERILVVGCGTGGHTRFLSQSPYDIVAVDKSEDMIARAQEKHDGTPFRTDSLPGLDVEGPFDAIVLPYGIVHYLNEEELRRGLAELDELLTPGGVIIFDLIKKKEAPENEITVRRVDGSDYCFLTHIRPTTPNRDDYFHVMLTDSHVENSDKGVQMRLFSESLTQCEWILPELSDRGYSCEIYDGYGTGGWLQEDIRVCVAVDESDKV